MFSITDVAGTLSGWPIGGRTMVRRPAPRSIRPSFCRLVIARRTVMRETLNICVSCSSVGSASPIA